jgi:acetyl esterase/lipase
MPSFQSQFFFTLMRNRNLFKFRLKRDEWDFNTSIPEFRMRCEMGAARTAPIPEEITISSVDMDGLKAEWARPKDTAADTPVVFYTHGGGYVSGSCSDHRSYIAKLAKWSGMAVLLFEYRLAPEYPFPASMEDTLTAYRWLLKQGADPKKVVIFGESAGGGLCLATLLALKEKGLPLPAAGVALSPWTDLTLSGESYRTNIRRCISPKNMALVCSKYYVADNDLKNPLISPLFGDLHGLPPLLINVGDDETMRDDSTRFAEKARAAGVDVKLRVEKGMGHCYPLMAPLFPEATEALQEICQFMQAHVK